MIVVNNMNNIEFVTALTVIVYLALNHVASFYGRMELENAWQHKWEEVFCGSICARLW